MCLEIEMSKPSSKKRVSKRGLGEFVGLNNLKGKMLYGGDLRSNKLIESE